MHANELFMPQTTRIKEEKQRIRLREEVKEREEREREEKEKRAREERERKEKEEREKEKGKRAKNEAQPAKVTSVAKLLENKSGGEELPSKEDLLALQKKMRDAQNSVRRRIAMELLDTEKSYFNNLKAIDTEIISKLKADSNVSKEEIASMFGNLSLLVIHHDGFLKSLLARVSSWSDDSIISDLFLNECHFLPCYQDYLTNYHRASLYCKYYAAKKASVNDLLNSFNAKRRKTSGLSLEDFLVLPVQRVPRYALLLRELQKYTSKNEREHEDVGRAIEFVQKTLTAINSNIDQNENKLCSTLLNIDAAVDGFTPILKPSLDVKRRVVHEGALLLVDLKSEKGILKNRKSSSKQSILGGLEKNMQFFCYVFNDILLLCLPREGDEKGSSKIMEKKPYCLLSIVPIEMIKGVVYGDKKKYPNRFTLEFTSDDIWTLEAANIDVCSRWMLNIEHCRMIVAKADKDKV